MVLLLGGGAGSTSQLLNGSVLVVLACADMSQQTKSCAEKLITGQNLQLPFLHAAIKRSLVTDGRITSQGQGQVRSKAWHIIHIIISCIEALPLSLRNLPTRLIRLAGTTHVLQYADQRLPRENQQPKRLVFSKTFCVSPCVARSWEVLTSSIFRMSLRTLTFTVYLRDI
jgi:hypothetical protein